MAAREAWSYRGARRAAARKAKLLWRSLPRTVHASGCVIVQLPALPPAPRLKRAA